MSDISRAIDFQLKIALSDADFLALVRNTPQTELARRELELASEHTDIVARYSTGLDTLSLTGMLHERFPINFTLKSGSKSHINFLKLLHAELGAFSHHAKRDLRLDSRAVGAAAELQVYLERRLKQLSVSSTEVDDDSAETIDLYRSDFQPTAQRSAAVPFLHENSGGKSNRVYGLRVVDEKTGEALLQTKLTGPARKFRLFASGELGPQLISGFFALEPRSEVLEAESVRLPALEGTLDSFIRFTGPISVERAANGLRVAFSAKLTEIDLSKVRFYLHWGPYQQGSGWVDEEFISAEVSSSAGGEVAATKVIVPEEVGQYGFCACAAIDGMPGRIWSTTSIGDDVKFDVSSEMIALHLAAFREQRVADRSLEVKILTGLSSFKEFVRVANQLVRQSSARRLSRMLFEVTRGDEGLRSLVSSYYRAAITELEAERSDFPRLALRRTVRLLQNVGIGEVVLVAPEGPHAIAGGLAQVIVGLSKSWSKEGVPCTIISPLYEQAQGNQHRSAEEVIRDGVQLVDRVVPLKRLGVVRISFGATRASGSLENIQPPRMVPAIVYSAEYAGIRVFFLRHERLADRLYHFTSSEDQLRKALFLSRGALELIRDGRFGIVPDLIISNDWLAALIPPLLRTDPRYRNHSRLSGAETAHAIHNAGPAFQGRFFVNQFGEDIWPLVGIGDEHFFGLCDRNDRTSLNLTAGAIHHSSRGVLTVSKPYARQLLTPLAGQGLESILQEHKESLFGISNGVDLEALRATYRELGEHARAELGLAPIFRTNRVNPTTLVRKLPRYKLSAKTVVQKKFGLELEPNAVLFSMVGRLTEQKGVQLLTATPTPADYSDGRELCLIERVLLKHPKAQFLIVGPPARMESEVQRFEEVFADLEQRYPKRVRGLFNFIPHRQALEITHASDFFLMPSRYEPGGITQLESLAAGTLVVGHNVGGIAATLEHFNPDRGTGNSFLFNEFSANALYEVMLQALTVFENKQQRLGLIAQAALAKNDWSHRAPKYLSLLQYASGALEKANGYRHLDGRRHLLESLKV